MSQNEKIQRLGETLSKTAIPGIKAGVEVSLGMAVTAVATQSLVETVLHGVRELPGAVDRNLKAMHDSAQPAPEPAAQPAPEPAETGANGAGQPPKVEEGMSM